MVFISFYYFCINDLTDAFPFINFILSYHTGVRVFLSLHVSPFKANPLLMFFFGRLNQCLMWIMY